MHDIPFLSLAQSRPGVFSRHSRPSAPASVLLLEDHDDRDPILRADLCDALLAAGFRVYRAADIPGALRLLHTAPIDVLLTDRITSQALDPDGRSFFRLVRLARGVPVVLMTDDEDAGDLLALGAADVVVRPLDWEDLVSRLYGALDIARRASSV
jgi:DNA-binding response OmpR family regulator